MTDLISQAINEADSATQFRQAAMLVEQHIRSDRDPDLNAALAAQLAYRGHVLIAGYGGNAILARVHAQEIAAAVVRILSME